MKCLHIPPRRQRLWLALILWAGASFASPAAHAQADPQASQDANRSAEVILRSITRPQVESIMRTEGYSISTDDDGDLQWKIDGYAAWIFIAKDNASLQFYTGFGTSNATPERVNRWNRTRRYSRSYISEDGHPRLELDLDFAGGITQGRLEDFLKTCVVSFATWRVEVIE